MGAILGPVVLFVIVAVVIVALVKRSVADQSKVHDTLTTPDVPSLRYSVPNGHDPAPVLAALASAGFVASSDSEGVDRGVLIGHPEGEQVDREAVREVLSGVEQVDHPRFDDE